LIADLLPTADFENVEYPWFSISNQQSKISNPYGEMLIAEF
jgi:hypothetical protein